MLGTDIHNLLATCKITPEWYREVKGRLGLEPTCNCEMWEDILNRTHAAYQENGWRAAKKAYNEATAYYAQPR